MKNKLSFAMSLAVILAMLLTAVAFADNLNDNATSSGLNTINAGSSTTITYQLVANSANGDVAGCDATSAKPVTVTITKDAAVSGPSSISFTDCGQQHAVQVTFSANTPGSYSITHNISGGVTGSKFNNNADFTLTVNAVTPTNQAPTLSLPGDITKEATSAAGAVATFSVTASDQEDGALTPTCNHVSGETFPLGTTEVDCSVTDSGGLTTSGMFNVVVVDTTAPSLTVPADITAEATRPAGAAVSFSATATDAVDPAPVVTCVPASGSTFALGTTTVSCTAKDAAGNTSAAKTFNVNVVDTTAPSLTLPGNITQEATSPAGNAVTYSASATDAVDGSVAVTCTPASGSTFPIMTTTVNCSATDSHGNKATGSFTVTVEDTTAPSISCGASDGQWHANDVSITCTASDSGSGLANAADASFSLSTNVPAGTEDANASTGSHDVCDVSGNCATAGPISGFMIDKKAPVVSCGSSDGLWHATDQSVTCTATDGGSGPASQTITLSTNVASGTETNNASTNSQVVSDAVGNSVTAGPVSGFMIDKKAPVVSCGSSDGLWHATDQSVTCTATDGGSGPASQTITLSTNVASGTETNNASTNSAAVNDAVGNSVTAGPVSGFMIDKKAPSITITVPTITTYTLNQVVASSFTCVDGGSGVANCGGSATVDTSSTGSHTFTVTATDNVGNTTSASVTYNVKFAICVLFDQAKSHKSGSTVPLKLQLCDANGVNFSSASIVVTATTLKKSDGTASPTIDDSGAANSPDNNFRYDATLAGYIFNLSTKGLATGTWNVMFTVNGASDPSYFVHFDVK